MVITTWFYLKNLDPKEPSFLHLVNGNLKDVHLGLVQAPEYFQRLVNEVLSGLAFAFGYLDNILVFSPDMQTHLKHLRSLFEKLREAEFETQGSQM